MLHNIRGSEVHTRGRVLIPGYSAITINPPRRSPARWIPAVFMWAAAAATLTVVTAEQFHLLLH
jgi:hypothetical protein